MKTIMETLLPYCGPNLKLAFYRIILILVELIDTQFTDS